MRLLALAINLVMICVATVAVYILVVFLQMPSLDSILNETRAPTITFLDNAGIEMRASNRIMGTPVSVANLPPYVYQAIIAIEDKRFYDHGAIDPRGLVRAMFSNIIRGHIAAGGSSITQQTAKNIFLSRDKKLSRKIQELILAQWLENRFDKNQILELYMNRVSLVGGLRGIDAAARALFNTTADKLTVAQSAQIAAMLKAPSTYSPRTNPNNNIARARIILREMVRQEYIDLETAQSAARELGPATVTDTNTNIFRYWTDYVEEVAKSAIGAPTTDIIIHTTLDRRLQEHSALAVAKSAPYQSAIVAMTSDGAITAMVGGRDYQGSQFNRATARRQPGSAFKAAVYLVALENGMTPDTFVNDSPFAIGDYNPKNYNERYYGDITIGTAFAKSVNSVPLKLTETFGIDAVLSMAARLGVGSKLRREYSTVLGSSEMTLVDLTTMYDVIYNDGMSVRPYAITKITDTAGNILYERNPSDAVSVLSLGSVYFMQNLLANVTAPGGTGGRAASDNVLGGKTGTSNDNRDAWFVGRADDLTIGVWIGNDDFTPMDSKITGGTLPAEIFREIIDN